MLKVELIGNLGADAEVKESNGSKFVTMRVAHSRKWTMENGEEKESTIWVDVTLNDAGSKVLPYLRQGLRVFVRGHADLRVYSSPKDRCMKAGLTVRAQEIEIVGGSCDDVPRKLVIPETGQLVDVTKHYWVDIDTKGMKKTDLRPLCDQKGRLYNMDAGGFVHVVEENVNSESPQKDS